MKRVGRVGMYFAWRLVVMQQNKNQREIALRFLVAALEHNAQVLDLRESRALDEHSRSCFSAAARLSISLSEEITAISGIKNMNFDEELSGDSSLIRDLTTAFRVCLDELPLGPVRDHIVQGYLRLKRLTEVARD